MKTSLLIIFSIIIFCNNNYGQSQADKLYVYKATMPYVKEKLKSPSSAEFPSFWTYKDHVSYLSEFRVYIIQSYVDSQNSFGAMIRTEWKAMFQYDSYSTKIIDIAFGVTAEELGQRNLKYLESRAVGKSYTSNSTTKAKSTPKPSSRKQEMGDIFKVTKATSLRKGAGSDHAVMNRLKVGDRVMLLEKINKYWYEVIFDDDKQGFVKAAVLEYIDRGF